MKEIALKLIDEPVLLIVVVFGACMVIGTCGEAIRDARCVATTSQAAQVQASVNVEVESTADAGMR